MRISDWSSDVCSSDLLNASWVNGMSRAHSASILRATSSISHWGKDFTLARSSFVRRLRKCMSERALHVAYMEDSTPTRSEESRVGKECVSKGRSRWSTYH